LHLIVRDANEGLFRALDKIRSHTKGILGGRDAKVLQPSQVFSLHCVNRKVIEFSKVNHGKAIVNGKQ